uniref:Uncharacterized protein n=1 Tax=viral metagenome TaxID=1070528 RepID=A0A6C0H5K6_9ZZZZ
MGFDYYIVTNIIISFDDINYCMDDVEYEGIYHYTDEYFEYQSSQIKNDVILYANRVWIEKRYKNMVIKFCNDQNLDYEKIVEIKKNRYIEKCD